MSRRPFLAMSLFCIASDQDRTWVGGATAVRGRTFRAKAARSSHEGRQARREPGTRSTRPLGPCLRFPPAMVRP